MSEAFHDYYFNIYKDRWSSLFEALGTKFDQSFSYKNPFLREFSCLNDLFEFKTAGPIAREQGLLAEYYLDPASVAPVLAIEEVMGADGFRKSDFKALDLCAAPGGKGLLLAGLLKHQGELILNEPSRSRREQLKKVVQQYIPMTVRERIFLTGKPGQNFYSEKSQFDLVLIDAPCSGEKHLLVNRKELQSWTPSRSKKLSQLQYSLICAGYLCLKAGGVLVFSTCSVSPLENQSVVAKLMERYPEKLKELPVKECFSGQEKCEWGYQLFPDQAQMGPIYWCALKKLA